MADEPKIELLTLWQRQSAKGTVYMTGFLGSAKVVAFVDNKAEPREGVDAVWKVYVQPTKRGTDAKPKPTRTAADRSILYPAAHGDRHVQGR